MSNQVRAVLLDAVGTVLYPEPAAEAAYFEAGRRFGSRLARDEVVRRYHAAFRRQEGLDRAAGDGRTDEDRERRRWREIVTDVFDDVADPAGLFADLWSHFASPQSWGVYDDVATAWHALERRGLALGLASNFDARLAQVCRGFEPLARCERLFVSSRLGFRKPHQGFFATIEAALDLLPREIMLVGDSLEHDVHAALAAGWHAVHLKRPPQRGAADPQVSTIGTLAELAALLGD